MGADSASPCTRVKHLANLLRNKASSQQHASIYEDRRPESIGDTEKTDGKGTASGQKGPWDQHRDQGDCSPKPDSWEKAELVVPSPAKQGLSSTEKSQGGE